METQLLNTRAELDTKLLLEEQLASSEVKLADLKRERLKSKERLAQLQSANEDMRSRLQVEVAELKEKLEVKEKQNESMTKDRLALLAKLEARDKQIK